MKSHFPDFMLIPGVGKATPSLVMLLAPPELPASRRPGQGTLGGSFPGLSSGGLSTSTATAGRAQFARPECGDILVVVSRTRHRLTPSQATRRPGVGLTHSPGLPTLMPIEERGPIGPRTPPSRQDGQDRNWPSCSLQPEARTAIEAEIAALWARS